MLTISENDIVISWVEVMMDVGRISSKPNSVSLLKPQFIYISWPYLWVFMWAEKRLSSARLTYVATDRGTPSLSFSYESAGYGIFRCSLNEAFQQRDTIKATSSPILLSHNITCGVFYYRCISMTVSFLLRRQMFV